MGPLKPRPLNQDVFLRKYGGLLQISEDNRFVACAAGYEAVVLDMHGSEVMGLRQKLAAKSEPARSWSVAISAEAGMVAAGYDDGTVSVWSLDSGQLLSQRRVGRGIVRSIVFAGLIAGGRFSKQRALLAVALGEQIVMFSAASLGVLGALPCDVRQPLMDRGFTSVCADRDGRFIAAGRGNGEVHIWLRGAREYDLRHSFSVPGDIRRVIFPAQGMYVTTMNELYIARGKNAAREKYARGEPCEISRWEFSARAEPSQKAAYPADDVTDIAAVGDGMVLWSQRYESRRRSMVDYHRWVSGAVESRGLPLAREKVRYFSEFEAGALSVAVTTDLRTAFVRCDNGQVAVVRPRG